MRITAADWGLSREQVLGAHHDFMHAMVVAALADGRVTTSEREDLDAVASLLAMAPGVVDAFLYEEAETLWGGGKGYPSIVQLKVIRRCRARYARLLSGGQGGTGHGQLSPMGGCRRGGTYPPDSPVSHDPRQTRFGSVIRPAVEGSAREARECWPG